MEMQKQLAVFLMPLLWLVAMMVIATQGQQIPRPFINSEGAGIGIGAANRRMYQGKYTKGLQGTFPGMYGYGMQGYGLGQYPSFLQGYQNGGNPFGFQNYGGQYPMAYGNYFQRQYPQYGYAQGSYLG